MKKLKLMREWFQDLDSEVLKMVEANMGREKKSARLYTESEPSLHQALLGAFDWDSSPEGLDFWCRQDDKIIELHGY